MNRQDHFECEVLEDGTIRSVTDPISPANHSSAEKFFKFLADTLGGPVEKARRKTGHVHVHSHEEQSQ